MKKYIIPFFIILTLGKAFGQTDSNGNPVFNSVSTNEKSVEDFLLISNYYTLKNNIDHKLSSVFISKSPTLEQIEKAAINLNSNFFILTKESKIVLMIILSNEPKREFLVIVMAKNKQFTFPCNLKGDITENRANELIKEKYDLSAVIDNGMLKFNQKEFKIIKNQDIEDAVLNLIKNKKLDKNKASDVVLASKNQLKEFILDETKEGGKLDFFTPIKGNEYDGIQIKPGLITTKKEIALYQWGRACFDIGVNTIEDAYDIYAQFRNRGLNEGEKIMLKMGFNKEFEK